MPTAIVKITTEQGIIEDVLEETDVTESLAILLAQKINELEAEGRTVLEVRMRPTK